MTAAGLYQPSMKSKHREPGVGLRPEPMLVQHLTLEGREEAFAQGVVVGIADAAHRRTDTGLATTLAEGDRCVPGSPGRSGE
jgi:hypothetical protein